MLQERFRDAGQPGGWKLRNYLAPMMAVIAENSQEVPWRSGSCSQAAGWWSWCAVSTATSKGVMEGGFHFWSSVDPAAH